MEQTSSTLTPAQAQRVVIDGVNREAKRGNEQAHALVRDAIKLQGHNVRKLASAAEVNGQLSVGFDSYLSYMSNAAGVAGMFEWDLAAFEAWLAENPTIIGLSAIYKHFRDAFGPAKPAKDPKVVDPDAETPSSVEALSGTPLEVILSLLPHLSAEELQQVVDVIRETQGEVELEEMQQAA